MLHLLYGKDSFRSRKKLSEVLAFFKSEIGDLGVFRIDKDSFKENEFDELLRSKTLFGEKYIVVCDGLIENKDIKTFIFKNLKRCSESNNIFIFLENELKADSLKSFKKDADKIEEFKLPTGVSLKKWVSEYINKENIKIPIGVQTKIIEQCGSDLWCVSTKIEKYNLSGEFEEESNFGEYNPFAICDAVAQRNKVRSWVLFQKAVLSGISEEEVFWKIVWQIKNLLLVKKLSKVPNVNIAKESGLHPFVVKKNMQAINNFTEEELEKYSSKLVNLYHEFRRGNMDILFSMERLLIS